MARAWVPHWHWETANLNHCRASVADGGRSVGFHQCWRKPVTEPDADGLRWCKQHSPEATEARERASAERGAAEGRAIKARWAALRETEQYAAFGRAAEPVLRAFATAPRFEPCPPDHHCIVDEARAALALLDGQEAT